MLWSWLKNNRNKLRSRAQYGACSNLELRCDLPYLGRGVVDVKGVEGCGKGGERKTMHSEEIERGEGRVAGKRDLREEEAL